VTTKVSAKVTANLATKATAKGTAKAKIDQRGRGHGDDSNNGNRLMAELIIYYLVGW
jgi:hypothetical protein